MKVHYLKSRYIPEVGERRQGQQEDLPDRIARSLIASGIAETAMVTAPSLPASTMPSRRIGRAGAGAAATEG